MLDAGRLSAHIAELMAVARDVAVETGTPLRLVDAGGGLGIPYAEDERPLDLARLGRRLAELRAGWDADEVLRDTQVLLEPGRWIVGPAGALLLRVLDVKGDPKSPLMILDGGINADVRPALVGTEQRLALLAPDAASRDRVAVTAAGPLCTGLDVLARGAAMPRPEPGDLVAMLDAGAYGFTESMPLFLSHPTAAETAVRGGQARLIRPRITPGELLDRQTAPDW
jgi:diaminopimelate decarboxylase